MEGVADESFDFVYSSHCLEHIDLPRAALLRWRDVLKPGGYLVLLVPDEDMYEQGVWPSTMNSDHKHTFAVGKHWSWSPVSLDVALLLRSLEMEVIKIERVEEGFDFGERRDRTPSEAECCIECVARKPRRS